MKTSRQRASFLSRRGRSTSHLQGSQSDSRRLRFESLEDRRMLAAVTVGNALDVVNAPDTSSIAALIANDGGDGISLREAITASNNTAGSDTISFDTSVFNGEAIDVIRLQTGQLVISEAVHIDGGSQAVVISGDASGDDVLVSGTFLTNITASETAGVLGDNNGRVLDVVTPAGDEVKLTGLTITGGNGSGHGNGIKGNDTNLVIENSAISGNRATNRGGGIHTDDGDVTLTDSTVSGNSSGDEGGGIWTGSGNVTLMGSTVSGNNSAADGGGIRTGSGAVTLMGSTVSGNSTTGIDADGGGILAFSGNVTLTNSTVSGNSSSDDGGGIRTRLSGDVTLTNSTVSGNSSADVGGGIVADSTSTVTLTSSTVSGNSSADNGGGIWTSSGAVTLTDSTVSENSTLADGGGIFTLTGEVTLTGSTVSGNTSADDGGGIFTDSGAVTLTSSTISGNRTTGSITNRGGGIYTDSGTVLLMSSTISGNSTTGINSSGGGIFTLTGAVTLTSSTISGNSAMGSNTRGGGIYTAAGDVMLTSSTVTENTAGGAGGGVFVPNLFFYSPTFLIENSIVADNNMAGTAPDLAHDFSGTLTVNHSLIGNTSGTAITATTGTGNILNQAADLASLANNGGPTETHALLASSPAIDAGDPSIVFDANVFDQRGAPSVRVVGGRIDIGALEDQPVADSADFDTDGDVDGSDFLAWQRGFGTAAPNATPADGDANGDKVVDATDLLVWEDQFGSLDVGPVFTVSRELQAPQYGFTEFNDPFDPFQGSIAVDVLEFGATPLATFAISNYDVIELRLTAPAGMKYLLSEAAEFTWVGDLGFNFPGASSFESIDAFVSFNTLSGTPPTVDVIGSHGTNEDELKIQALSSTNASAGFEFDEIIFSWDVAGVSGSIHDYSIVDAGVFFGVSTNGPEIGFVRRLPVGSSDPGLALSLVPISPGAVAAALGSSEQSAVPGPPTAAVAATDTALIDAALAMQWVRDSLHEEDSPALDEPQSLEVAFKAALAATDDISLPFLRSATDALEPPTAFDVETEKIGEPWLSDELLEQVFG